MFYKHFFYFKNYKMESEVTIRDNMNFVLKHFVYSNGFLVKHLFG